MAPAQHPPGGRAATAPPQPTLAEARALADRGQVDEALAAAEVILAAEGPKVSVLELLGCLQLARNRLADAQACFRKAVYLEPNHAEALLQLSVISQRLGDPRRRRGTDSGPSGRIVRTPHERTTMKPTDNQLPPATVATDTHGQATDPMARLLDRPLTPSDLEETTRRVGQSIMPPDRQAERVLVFRLADETFALAATEVGRVTQAVSVHRIPHRSNRIVHGLCNIDGELRLCGSLSDLLGTAARDAATASAPGIERRMVIMAEDHGGWAFAVDAVVGVRQVEGQRGMRPPVTVEQAHDRYTESLVLVDGAPVARLSAERLQAGFEAALA